MKNTKNYTWTINQVFLLAISLMAIVGAAVYKIYALNWLGVVISLVITGLAMFLIARQSQLQKWQWDWKWRLSGVELFYLLIWAINAWLLYQGRSGEAIVTPWKSVSPLFFVSFGALSLSLLYLATKANRYTTLFTVLYLMISYSVAVIVYGVGYGFDPFIHQATIKFIDEFGAVSPKPLYYAGQYSLEIIAHKLTGINLAWLDKALVPMLAATLLPFSLWQNFKTSFQQQVAVRIVIVVLLGLGASLFLITTPQNLAYLFLVLLIVSSMNTVRQNWILNYALALAALVTQPVAGIPALLAIGSVQLHTSRIAHKKIFVSASLVLLTLLLPLSFFLIDKSYSPDSHLGFNNFSGLGIKLSLENSASPWLNFAQNWLDMLILVIVVLVGLGYYYNRRLQEFHDNHYRLYLWQGLGMIIAYFLTKMISFNFLIDYERDNYANRMLVCALIFWLPLLAIGLYELVILILQAERRQKISWAIVSSALLVASLYTSYPRQDHYLDSHSYATSRHDIAAVKWINADNTNYEYIVLANQQVSAAALRQFGFAKYHGDEMFYYPIPTGGLLYQYYLALVKEPNLATISAAAELAGVKRVYVVINEYWWQAKRLIAELDLIASEHQVINGGKDHVFRFDLKK